MIFGGILVRGEQSSRLNCLVPLPPPLPPPTRRREQAPRPTRTRAEGGSPRTGGRRGASGGGGRGARRRGRGERGHAARRAEDGGRIETSGVTMNSGWGGRIGAHDREIGAWIRRLGRGSTAEIAKRYNGRLRLHNGKTAGYTYSFNK
jgi:hypothetical protein